MSWTAAALGLDVNVKPGSPHVQAGNESIELSERESNHGVTFWTEDGTSLHVQEFKQ